MSGLQQVVGYGPLVGLAEEILRPVVPFAARPAPVDCEPMQVRVSRIVADVDLKKYRAAHPPLQSRHCKRIGEKKIGSGEFSFIIPSQSPAGTTQVTVDEFDAIYGLITSPPPGAPWQRWHGARVTLDRAFVLHFDRTRFSDAVIAIEDIFRRSIGKPRPKGVPPPRVIKLQLLP